MEYTLGEKLAVGLGSLCYLYQWPGCCGGRDGSVRDIVRKYGLMGVGARVLRNGRWSLSLSGVTYGG
jgi:hypothetical protein